MLQFFETRCIPVSPVPYSLDFRCLGFLFARLCSKSLVGFVVVRLQTAKTWCTVNVVLRTIVCIYVAACISQITRFFDTIYKYVSACLS